jgi:myo-inositol-1(or 4)-monophosphatase
MRVDERDLSEGLELAVEAAHAAARIQREASSWTLGRKGPVNFVTEVDLACEARIREILQAGTPEIPILAEEGGGVERAPLRWIVDPLDGTTNFVHGYPHFGPSIALEVGGRVALGCVLDTPQDALYTAMLGRGAFLGDERLHVSAARNLDESLLVTGFPYDRRERASFYMAFFVRYLVLGRCIRRSGAASVDFCHLARGIVDGFWEFGLKPWDVAAGSLIVAEAGGRVTNLDATPFDLGAAQVLATNGVIHAEMLDVAARVYAGLGVG